MKRDFNLLTYLLLPLAALVFASCATPGVAGVDASAPGQGDARAAEANQAPADASVVPAPEAAAEDARPEELKAPEPAPAPEKPPEREKAPVPEAVKALRAKVMSLSANDTPLSEALYVVADSVGLNLVMERGVDPDTPVTMRLKGLTAEETLETIMNSSGYFYEVRGNLLVVKAMETRMFEFGTPSVIQDYSVSVGGDILGAAKGEDTIINGNVSQKIESDKSSFKLWDSLEVALAGLLGLDPDSHGAGGTGPGFNINRMSGIIVVTAARKDLEKIQAYLARLKGILNRQVVIEARIVEVQFTDSLKAGIDWSFLGDGIDGAGTIGFGTTGLTDVVDPGTNFNVNITGGDFTLLLRALRTQGEVNVLSNPRVNIMNGQTALLSVGRKVDFVSKVETTTMGISTDSIPTITFSVETSSILSGIIFGLVPYIEDGGEELTMTITPIISDLVEIEDKVIGNVGENSVELGLPTVDLRELSTTVKVRNEQMVVIGGLINNDLSDREQSVPLLGDIPILGLLFKNKNKEEVKTELVIMLKPSIVPGEL